MRDFSSRKVSLFFNIENKNLNGILIKIKEINELNLRFFPILEPGIRKYCQIANRIGHRLIVLTANASIATQLRFQTPDLLRKFKQDPLLAKINEIQFKVRPVFQSETRRPPKTIPLLSTKTAKIIQDIASNLDDEKLKEVMSRIAKHTILKT